MPQKESMTAPEGNGPIPQYAIPGKITLKDFRRALSEIRGEILGEFKEDLRSMDQRLASLQRDARQSRPAMEADVQVDTKICERTEGAAKAVQAMNGDSFSAKRIQDGPKSSTIFGERVEPPALPCRDDVVVQNGAAAPKSCLSPLKMRTPTAAGGLLPPGETSTTTRTTFDHSTLWFCQTEETILKTSFYPPRTTTVSGGTYLLYPPAEGSLKQNRGKTGCLIQAVLEVVSAPARFWERRARRFVGRLCLRRPDEAATFCGSWMTWASTCWKGTCESFTPYV